MRRLERLAEGNVVSIPQPGGTVRRFPEGAIKDAYLNLCARMGAGGDAPPEHPLLEAARNSTATEWSGSIFATDVDATAPVEDLSER
ncbi:MAG: hypothetical protein M3N18_06735 [Actinomycetota bacterium]|nr:hypothetical protein [Actinomycetota bacterium]